MYSGAIRRSQLVSPFGVGAMSILVDGTSVITGGLDHWYEPEDTSSLAIEEYEENDRRLENRLKVSSFRLPPDFRETALGSDRRNLKLSIPVFRFPLWCFCQYCKRLERTNATQRDAILCPDRRHEGSKKAPKMSQVPFVAICDSGHIDDFPFREWVHGESSPSCNGVLRLKSSGGGGLEGQNVSCDECHKVRNLRGVTQGRYVGGVEYTNLSDQLDHSGVSFLCAGARPWLGESHSDCSNPLRAALRGAGNVYFPKVESSLFLPEGDSSVRPELREFFKLSPVKTTFTNIYDFVGADVSGDMVRKQLMRNVAPELFSPFSDEELLAGYLEYFGAVSTAEGDAEILGDEELTGSSEWRYPEYLAIRETPKSEFLSASDPGLDPMLCGFLDRVRSVDVLRETRTLRGFTRVRDSNLKLTEGKSLLRRSSIAEEQDWLPAYVVKGEGIYLELDPQNLAGWETRPDVRKRCSRINANYAAACSERGLRARELSPRFILIHTLAHVLINQLVYSCGYSSASLRERLYVSDSDEGRMGGVLIYTAAGDSEGTMGGLVRMSRPANMRSVLHTAVFSSEWCSTDPVCMDSGEKGQGPDSCNLAACHGCALLPETSCEEFNRFLDRGLLVGTFDNRSLGYFSSFAG